MRSAEVSIPLRGAILEGELKVPPVASGLVVFAHGSGSSRHSSRNQSVARALREIGLGTLLFDLLTAAEEQAETRTRHLRFDIPFLAERLVAVTKWVRHESVFCSSLPSPLDSTGAGEGGRGPNISCRDLNIGYFGASTGAAAALVAAAELPEVVRAVVSRGGRPDLAGAALDSVKAPTLLIVGAADTPVIPLNEQAYARLRCVKALRVVTGASHLFEEAGALETVAELAGDWMLEHLDNAVR